jgi:hypothetical protein
MIKITLAFLLFASPVFAQDQAAAARAAAGCGPQQIQYDVKTDKKQHPAPQPETGKALVYVFEEVRGNQLGVGVTGVTSRVGLDGTWIGANRSKTYFFFSVDPGNHRLCTNWQSSVASRSKLGSAASLTAEAGKTYYFKTKVYSLPEREQYEVIFRLEPLDPAEAQLLVASSALSISQPKK